MNDAEFCRQDKLELNKKNESTLDTEFNVGRIFPVIREIQQQKLKYWKKRAIYTSTKNVLN